jgi:predicted transcriptional regulator
MEAICEVTMLYDSGIRDRLVETFERLSLSVEEVARKSEVPMSTLYNFLSEDRRVKSIKDTHLAAIIKAYPSINANYILTGEGNVFLKEMTDEKPVVYIIAPPNVSVKIREE